MAKQPKDKPITQADIAEYLNGQDDFQLELAVLRTCKEALLPAWHGGSYEDSVTKKSRQFDLRTQIIRGGFVLHLAIECKNLKSYFPLVVSRIPRQESEAYHNVLFCRPPDNDRLAVMLGTSKNFRIESPESFYQIGRPVGKSLSQVGRGTNNDFISGDSDVYEKWSQAVSQAAEWVSSLGDFYEQISSMHGALSVVMPILVVSDSNLWVADYNADGILLSPPTQTEQAELYLGKDYYFPGSFIEYSFSHLTIVTYSGFCKFLKQLQTQSVLDSFFPEKALKNSLS